MPSNEFTCPCCMYRAPQALFESIGGGKLKCRRCRSEFADPGAYVPGVTYADCTGHQPVWRFPFALKGENAEIRVRGGYLAYLAGPAGQRLWLDSPVNPIRNMPGALHVYYVCLTPTVLWGTAGQADFGAYGSARLSLTADFVRRFCGMNGHVTPLDKYLRDAVSTHITKKIKDELDRHGAGLLTQRDGYMNMLGQLEDGVQLTRIDPMGCRGAGQGAGFFTVYEPPTDEDGSATALPELRPPVDFLRPQKSAYTVRAGTEEVVIRSAGRIERHKAGESMDPRDLQGVERHFRYRTKEFDFPWGWGLYNQSLGGSGYYSAHGDISFYVDSTEKLSALCARTRSWQEFTERFYLDVLRKELADSLHELVVRLTGAADFDPALIRNHLSAMSVELTGLLNGEDGRGGEPAFRRYGLRVRQLDILSVDFYSVRR